MTDREIAASLAIEIHILKQTKKKLNAQVGTQETVKMVMRSIAEEFVNRAHSRLCNNDMDFAASIEQAKSELDLLTPEVK